MKLRMLLKRKKCGRLKSRLVAQGFLEAWWLTAGKESSPVLRQESLRALIFGGGIDDEFACIDVSTAFLQASAYTIDDYIRYATNLSLIQRWTPPSISFNWTCIWPKGRP